MTNPLSPALAAFGATYTPAQPQPGKPTWKCIQADGPLDIGGNHNIFVEVLTTGGERAVGVRVRVFNGGNAFGVTEPKPGSNYAVDFPIYAAGNAYGIAIADGNPSDEVFGMGLVAFQQHKSYHLTFQLMPADDHTDPAPPPPPSKDSYTLYRNGVLVWHS